MAYNNSNTEVNYDNSPEGMLKRAKQYVQRDLSTVTKVFAECGCDKTEAEVERALLKVKVLQVKASVAKFNDKQTLDSDVDKEMLALL